MEYIAFADGKAEEFRKGIDNYIDLQGISAPAAEADPGEPPLPDLKGSDQLDRLDLLSAGVRSVIWCTGFNADWSWVKIDVFDKRGQPRHRFGISDSQGLYFIGFPWLSKRKSGLLYGISEDATRIVQHITENVLASKVN
jgi:putative flavoprotein involved in K+ transport